PLRTPSPRASGACRLSPLSLPSRASLRSRRPSRPLLRWLSSRLSLPSRRPSGPPPWQAFGVSPASRRPSKPLPLCLPSRPSPLSLPLAFPSEPRLLSSSACRRLRLLSPRGSAWRPWPVTRGRGPSLPSRARSSWPASRSCQREGARLAPSFCLCFSLCLYLSPLVGFRLSLNVSIARRGGTSFVSCDFVVRSAWRDRCLVQRLFAQCLFAQCLFAQRFCARLCFTKLLFAEGRFLECLFLECLFLECLRRV